MLHKKARLHGGLFCASSREMRIEEIVSGEDQAPWINEIQSALTRWAA
ncbi:hypothetical protein [Dyella sp.]